MARVKAKAKAKAKAIKPKANAFTLVQTRGARRVTIAALSMMIPRRDLVTVQSPMGT